MQFSDEELIAFLLADAPSDLEAQIRTQLADGDSDLIERLSYLRMILGHVDSLGTVYEPPSGLVEGTLDRINAQSDEDATLNEDAQSETQEEATKVLPASKLSAAVDKPRSRNKIWDSTALTISLSLLCCLALPALVRARFEARRAQCEQNLRSNGRGLTEFALSSPDGRFPRVPSDGPAAFAGVYAVRLDEAGLLDSLEQLQCPSLLFSGVRSHEARSPGWSVETGASNFAAAKRTAQSLLRDFPSIAELNDLPSGRLAIFQYHAGGDYAYNLGVIEDKRPMPPRNAGRSHFAILADAPMIVDAEDRFLAHDGLGINILYEDGCVRFVKLANLFAVPSQPELQSAKPTVMPASLFDHPFKNFNGQHRIGLHPQDASLAPSHFPPLGP